jgi:hypothetical protein
MMVPDAPWMITVQPFYFDMNDEIVDQTGSVVWQVRDGAAGAD